MVQRKSKSVSADRPMRSDAVRNVDAWYKAYEIATGDTLFLKPDARIAMW